MPSSRKSDLSVQALASRGECEPRSPADPMLPSGGAGGAGPFPGDPGAERLAEGYAGDGSGRDRGWEGLRRGADGLADLTAVI
jgi:hypothetical protein